MRLVINAFSARLGGGQTYLQNLLARLPATDSLEVLVFAPAGLALPAHASLRRVDTRWPTQNPLLRALWERFLLPRLLRRWRADVLFCPGGVVATRAPAACRVVTMFRNMAPFDRRLVDSMPWGLQRLRNLILERVMLKSMAGADLTIFISDFARRFIESRVRIPNAVTIPHGIGESFRTHGKSLDRPSNLPGGDYLLYVSRFDTYKHHREVITGYSRLPQALRDKFALILVGETNLPEADRMTELIARLQLTDRVLMLGPVPYPELPRFYANAHATLFASSCENCPNILLEALGAGRPVLSSDVMPMPEFGGDGIDYFSPFDPDSIAVALQRVLADKEHASRIARAAEQRSARYDWAATASETWQRILSLPAQSRAR
ncbi:MAG TPA: glycosyltransferase family 1 protein [Lysobacter sp.]|jgi:glycosyltransferase involved in cell wall biosynthesis|nr:glycosyltransferase family 1 protein [Lysobacter sp.]